MDHDARKSARGRPPKRPVDEAGLAPGGLSRPAILAYALQMTRTEALQALSLVRLAQSLGVRTNAVRYHVGTRDDLLTGVMNLFFERLVLGLQRILAEPKDDPERIIAAGTSWLDLKSEFPGIARYIMAEDRFRIFQDPAPGETDFGATYFDAMFRLFESAGLGPAKAAELWHMMALLTTATAEHMAMHHAPSSHGDFLLSRSARFEKSAWRGIASGIPALVELDVRKAFDRQLRMLVGAFFAGGID